jgi:hypothetical protein
MSADGECTCSRVASRPLRFLANPVDCRLLTQCPVDRFGRDDLTGKPPHRLRSVAGVWELIEMLGCACTTWRPLALTSLVYRLDAYGQRPRKNIRGRCCSEKVQTAGSNFQLILKPGQRARGFRRDRVKETELQSALKTRRWKESLN